MGVGNHRTGGRTLKILGSLHNAILLAVFTSAITGLADAGTCPATGQALYYGLCCIHIPVLQWETENYIVRVDDLGHGRYRYAAWDSDENQGMEPNIVLTDGVLIRDGSGGNHHYEFYNAGYTYVVDIWWISEYDEPGELRVYEGNKCILAERVQEVMYSDLW